MKLTPICIVMALLLSWPGRLPAANVGREVVVPLKVSSGGFRGRDSRVFSVPVRCNQTDAEFVWGCSGWTVLSETFARGCGLRVMADEETADFRDSAGRPMFAGAAQTTITFAGRRTEVSVKVMKDAAGEKGMTGILGYEVARAVQWELDPDPEKPTLTVRPLKSQPTTRPLTVRPLKDDGQTVAVSLKIRGVDADLTITPQSTDVQAAPDLQRAWDFGAGKKLEDVQTYMGRVDLVTLSGRDAVDLGSGIVERDVVVLLVGDPKNPEATPTARSGIGASLLNRFVYCVDAEAGEFRIIKRTEASRPMTRPSTRAATRPDSR